MLHYQTIDVQTLELLRALEETPEFNLLHLAGGTSLALQIGHRKSVDLDLFGKFDVDDYQFTTALNHFDSVIQICNSKNIKSYIVNASVRTQKVN